MMSYPTQSNIESLRCASTSGRIQHRWSRCSNLFHLQCGLDIVAVHPANEQLEDINVIMCITRVSNSAAISRCDIIVRTYIRFAIGNTPSQQRSMLTPFHKLQVLSILDLLCLFFMMTSRLGSGVLLERS